MTRCKAFCFDYRVAILDFISGKDCAAALERNPAVLIGESNCTVDWYFPAPEDGIHIKYLILVYLYMYIHNCPFTVT